MKTMDLSINQEAMGVQNRFGNQVFKLNKFDETDVKGNNNLYNCRKTDADSDFGSPFRDGYSSENLQVDPSLFSYSSFKKAMDLRMHNRMDDGENRRTIFDDADYFAKNFFYKLLPITFEQVDEAIIHTEHNYSLFSLNSESETEEDCSRTMDYSQIKEKNYKRRRTKFKEESSEEILDGNEDAVDSNRSIPNQKEPPAPEPEPVPENSVQPLDLSTAPPVQEQKTDNCHYCHLKEQHADVREENLSSKLKCIQVTITRPDEKENYQPCDMFLNDIARLVPRLINNDCFEIDILDKTGDRRDDFQKHRLYYIIAESTWRLFQSTKERVILTNDHTLGPPVKKIEKNERPTFLVFDQFSLAKCLAEYCEEIGGCFEYTCVEEEKESEKEEVVKNTKSVTKAVEMGTIDERLIEMNAEETKVIEIEPEKIQRDKLNIKSKEANTEEITFGTPNHELSYEGKSSDNAETVEIKSEEEEHEYNFTESKPEKSENRKRKTEERNAEQIEIIHVETSEIETNAVEGKEIKMEAKNSSLYLHRKEKKTKKRLREGRKKGAKTKKRKIDPINFKSGNVRKEIKAAKVETEQTQTAVKSNETTITAVDYEYSKPDNTDTKETKETEMETNTGDVKINLMEESKAIEMKFENEKLIEENLKETKADEIQTENIRLCDGGTKSDEENVEKAITIQSGKRTSGIKGKKTIKKNKKLKQAVEIFEEKVQARVINVKEIKTEKDEKEKIFQTKEMKITKRNRRGRKKTRVGRKDIKTEEGSQPSERTNKPEKLERTSKIKQFEAEEAKNPFSKKKKVKSERSLPCTVSQIKTRSKSTSESETSRKPKTKTQKPKNTAKDPGRVGREETARKTRTGKALEDEKLDVKVKENENRIRGRKRKMVEEEKMANEKCLRSRGEKEKNKKMSASCKRKKK